MNLHFKSGQAASDAVRSEQDSAFMVQRNFEKIGQARQEISILKSAKNINSLDVNDRRAYEAAMWEGWPLF
jgi:hypothetical protein